eukprot:PhF_6_TR13601/c0_g1_i1/m.21767
MELLTLLPSNWSHVIQCMERNGLDAHTLSLIPTQWDSVLSFRAYVVSWVLRTIGHRNLGVSPECTFNVASPHLDKQLESIASVAHALHYVVSIEKGKEMIHCATPGDRSLLIKFMCHLALVLDNCRASSLKGVSVQQSKALDDIFLQSVLDNHVLTLGAPPMGAKSLEPFSTQCVDDMCRVKSQLEIFVTERRESIKQLKTRANIKLGNECTMSELVDALSSQYEWLLQFDSDLGVSVKTLQETIDCARTIIDPLLQTTRRVPETPPSATTECTEYMMRITEWSTVLENALRCLQDSCDVYVSLQERRQRSSLKPSSDLSLGLKARIEETQLSIMKLNHLMAQLPTIVPRNLD